MRGAPSRGVWKQLDGLFRFGVAGHLGDDELLSRFVGRRDQDDDAEAAFAVLVERHGPMVLGVCRRVLGDRHEAEDAFQATFLVLARKAASIARREQLANWLYGVACRTALDVRARATRRKARERKAHAMSPSEVQSADEAELDELRAILDEELARLPERYRGAVVLCELDGLSRHAAAQRLGIPEGTLSSRLARAKDLLRHRLTRRGLAPSTITLDAALAPEARAILIPPSLAGSTIAGRGARRGRYLPGRGRFDLGRNPDPRSSQGHAHRQVQRARPGPDPRNRRHHGDRRAGTAASPVGRRSARRPGAEARPDPRSSGKLEPEQHGRDRPLPNHAASARTRHTATRSIWPPIPAC